MTVNKKNPVEIFNDFAEDYLNFEKNPTKGIFWLDTMKFLCEKFGHPEKCCRCVHVAGSKGKGSVSMMIASVLEEAGYKVGVYSSPHIVDFRERIRLPNRFFDDEVYLDSVNELIGGIKSLSEDELPDKRRLTWFELATLYGMLCFRNAHVDYAVYEVGLGGRLDSTNVVVPDVCCITQIELEHTEFLGDTLEKIAYEKGGIIKEGVPVVVSRNCSCVDEVFEKIANEKKSSVFYSDKMSKMSEIVYKNIQCDKISNFMRMNLSVKSDFFKRDLNFNMRLLGQFQADNACTASIASRLLLPEIGEDVIERGINRAYLEGRLEILGSVSGHEGMGGLVLDGAHTVNSIRFTLDTVMALFGKSGKRLHLLFACAQDKDVDDMAPFFKNVFSEVTVTKPGAVKATDLVRVKNALGRCGVGFCCIEDFNEAILRSFDAAATDNAILVVTGSFYLVSEVKKYMQNILDD